MRVTRRERAALHTVLPQIAELERREGSRPPGRAAERFRAGRQLEEGQGLGNASL